MIEVGRHGSEVLRAKGLVVLGKFVRLSGAAGVRARVRTAAAT